MFRFSAGTEYALRAVMRVARSTEPLFIREIAEQEAIPQSFLSKLIQSLSHGGVLEARRGMHGGVSLARPKEEISVLEIIEACEGPLQSPTCLLNHTSQCSRSRECPIHEVWQKAQEGMTKVLTQTKLSDLLKKFLIGGLFFTVLFQMSKVEAHGFYKNKPEATEALVSKGKTLYQKQCAVCHGPKGMADGEAAYLLHPKPRNFVQDKFRLVSTTNLEATDDDLFEVLTRGMSGSAMPPWEHLSEEERWALVYYVRSLTGKDVNAKIAPETVIQVPPEPPVTQKALKRGRELFVVSCAGCHGLQGRGDGQQKMVDNLGYPTKPRDLTAGVFKGDSTSEELYFRMVGGMPGTPMPSYAGAFTQEEIWALIHYVQTLPQKGVEARTRLRSSQITANKVSGDIDLNPFARVWKKSDATFVVLTPLWWRDDRVEVVEIKALHNGKEIAFYLKWNDPTKDEDLVAPDFFSDGAALQFSDEKDPPFFGMGDSENPVHLWHWKAAWEGVGDTRKDVETEYAHTAVDWYESQKTYPHGAPFEAVQSKTSFHDPEFTTGWGAGNPLSDPLKTESAEEGMAEGIGTFTTQRPKIEKVKAKGVWEKGSWHIVFVRPLNAQDEGALQFQPGGTASIAFAVWDGAHKDRNGQKMVSIWNTLVLERE